MWTTLQQSSQHLQVILVICPWGTRSPLMSLELGIIHPIFWSFPVYSSQLSRPEWVWYVVGMNQIKLVFAALYPPTLNGLSLDLAHWPKQTITSPPSPPVSHGLSTPAIEIFNSRYFYLSSRDHNADILLQDTCLVPDCSPMQITWPLCLCS